MPEAKCSKCGSIEFEEKDGQIVCKNCGEPCVITNDSEGIGIQGQSININVNIQQSKDPQVSEKSWIATLLLEIFLGELGIHRFYAGRWITGIIWLLTAGLFGIGWLVDLIVVACGKFKDKHHKYIKHN